MQTEREALQKALEAKDGLLREEASKRVGLAADLDQAQAEVARLTEEANDAAIQSPTRTADLERAQATVEELETDAHMLRRSNNDLATKAWLAKTRLGDALKEKAAKLDSALVKQKTKLEEKYVAELDTAMAEEERKLDADYKAQLPGIRDRAWELGWKAAMKKVGIPGDSPVFRNSPKFPLLDSDLHSIIAPPSIVSPSSLAPVASVGHEASSAEASPAVTAAPKAHAAVPFNFEVPPKIFQRRT